jgi:hypothetical protein
MKATSLMELLCPKKQGFLKVSVNASDSVKLTDSDFMHISHKYFMVKSGREQKRTREVPKQTKSVDSSTSEERVNVRKSVTSSSTKTVAEDMFNSPVTCLRVVTNAKVHICMIWKQWKVLGL